MEELRRRAGEAALRRMQGGVGGLQGVSASTRDDAGGQGMEFGSHREAEPSVRESARRRKQGGSGKDSDDRGAVVLGSARHNLVDLLSQGGSHFLGGKEGNMGIGSYEEAMPKEKRWEPTGQGAGPSGFNGGSHKDFEADQDVYDLDIYDLDSGSEVVDLLDSSEDENGGEGSAEGGWGTSSREKRG